MKITEILVNHLMSTTIFEMAFERKIAIDKARNLQMQIARHIVKIIMYSNSSSVNHWIGEVNGWLLDIQDTRLKGSGKSLDEKLLERILIEEPLGTIDDVQARMNRAYNEYPDLKIDQPDVSIVSNTVSWILIQACRDIATKQFKDIRRYL